MILVDSCGWLEYFSGGPLADTYEQYLKKKNDLIIPTIVLYEVYKKIKRETAEENASLAAAQMESSGIIISLNESIALLAADCSIEHALPMADAIVYATAKTENASLISSDVHFKGLANVKYIGK